MKCPPGTTSARGSYCIGHCKKTITTELVTDTVNPISSSLHIDKGENAFGENSVPHSDPIPYNPNNTFIYGNVVNSWRRSLQENWFLLENTSFEALTVPLYQYPLNPLETAKIFIDFTNIPENMIYNVHY